MNSANQGSSFDSYKRHTEKILSTFVGIQKIANLPGETIKKAYAPIEKIFEQLRYMIYVDPDTFNTLSGLYQSVQIDSSIKYPDKYIIYTNAVKTPQYDGQQFIVTKEIALVIAKLDYQYRHKIYGKVNKVPFNKHSSVLEIDGTSFQIKKDLETFNLCLMLFGSKQYIEKIWKWEDIKTKVLDHGKEVIDDENAFKLKVYRLNKRIENKIGFIDIILYKNKTVRVNPQYIYFFK